MRQPVVESDMACNTARIKSQHCGTHTMERYIAVEREELLADKTHDWFWVNQYGEPRRFATFK